MNVLGRDIGYSLRQLRKTPGFTVTAVLTAAVFATRLLRSLTFQVDALDPGVIVLASLSIFFLALLASLIPARRAASIDPMRALRME